jgi:hypothetical protein
MLGEKLYSNVTEELNRRSGSLDRQNYGRYLEGNSLNYSFSEMMTKTTYVRLVSPLYRTEIQGTLLDRNSDDVNYFNKTHWTDSTRGQIPPPGITSVRTAYVGEGATINTIKEATIELKVYSNEQYDKVVPEFVRIGRILYLEFGWSNPRIDILRAQAVPRDFLVRTGPDSVAMNFTQAQTFPEEFAINTNGNSDVFVGTVSNYSAKLNQQGGYDITIDLKTSGYGLYHSSTNKNKPQSIPIINENTSEGDTFQVAPIDERNGVILLSKIKENIQEVFSIKNAFTFEIRDSDGKEKYNAPQSSVYYSRVNETDQKLKTMINILEGKGFYVEPIMKTFKASMAVTPRGAVSMDLYNEMKAEVESTAIGFTAIHKTRDLIICMTKGSRVKIGKEIKKNKKGKAQETVDSFYINYYVSVKYAEDNILTRLFGTADLDSSRIVSGVRSLRVSTELNENFKFPDDNTNAVLESNLMLTHSQLIPMNFTDCLINTEAMKAVLDRSVLGVYESDDDDENSLFKGYTKSLSKTLERAFPFIIDSVPTKSDTSLNKKITNPNHVMAKIRNMYVNVNVIQDAFLGTANRNFCDRNFYPTTKDYQLEGYDNDPWYKLFWAGNDNVTYFQDQGVTFDKMSCVGTLREGLENMYNTISANFHNFPNFEVGGNVFLPGFLSVYDLRNVKTNDYFKFEVFSKDSIVKSLELNSKIPKNVELAATIGASTKFDLTDALGGVNSGLKAELLYDIDEEKRVTPEARYNPLQAASFGSTNYIEQYENISPNELTSFVTSINPGDSPGQIEFVINEGIKAGRLPQYKDMSQDQIKELTLSVYDGNTTIEFSDQTSYDGQGEVEMFSDASFNYLEVRRTAYNDSFLGIAPDFVKQNRPAEEDSDTNKKTNAQKVRDKYPKINVGLTAIGDVMDRLFILGGSIKYTTATELKDGPSIEETSDGIQITGIPVQEIDGTVATATLDQFKVLRGTSSKPMQGSRKVSFIQVNTHSDYQGYMDQIIYNDNVQSLEKLNNTISYFELSFKIDGISGILPGQAFTVSYLPDIVARNFFFIVKNIEQELTESGWETTITALMRRREMPLPQEKSKLKTKTEKKKKQTKKKMQQKPTPKPKVDPPLPMPERPRTPIPSEEEDILPDEVLEPLEFEDFSDLPEPPPPPPPPPPIERPAIPVPPDEEDIADDVDIEPLDFDFPTFDDWEVPPPPQPFVPYQMVENDTANIVLSMVDGAASIEPFANAPKQDIKIYPKGRPNSHPIIFSMGVTDVLSIQEFQNIRRSYFEAFGKDPEQLLNRLYTRFTYNDTMRDKDKDKKNFGEWDKREKTYFYVANRKDEDGKSMVDKLTELQNSLKAAGNDPANDTGLNNDFLNDAINAMLNQPERTKLTVLKEKKNIKIKKRRKAIVDPSTRQPQDDPPPNPKPKKKKPKPEPKPTSFYGGLAWQNNLLYRVVPKWKTLGAVLGKKDNSITQADRTRVIQQGTYYKNEIMYGGPKEAGPESAVPFDIRRTFWDSMIEKPEPNGHSSKSQKGRCRESESFLKNDNSYKYLERLKGPKVSDSVKTYQKRF